MRKLIGKQQHTFLMYFSILLNNSWNYQRDSFIKTIARASHFRKITFKNKLIATKQASKIYKFICRPLLDYGHPILLNCNNPAKENIRIAETTALRRLTKIRHPNNPLHNPSNTRLYDKTQVQPIMVRAKMLSAKFARQNCDTIFPLCNTISPGTARKHKLPAEPLLQILNTLEETRLIHSEN